MENDAEASTQWRSDQTGTRCRANQSELRYFEFDGTGSGALTDQQIQLIVFHRRVQLFFQRRQQTMDLVDEEDVAFLKVGKQSRDVAGFFDCRAGGRFQFRAHLVGDDVCERGFAEARWSSQ